MADIGDIITSILLIGGIYLVIRWLTKRGPSGNDPTRPPTIRGVTPQMVETVRSAFPDVPVPNLVYSLSRTRSTQATSEEILERGYLPAPPPSFVVPPNLYPPGTAPDSTVATTNTASTTATPGKPTTAKPVQSLIDRYGLTSRIPSRKGKERESTLSSPVDGADDSDVPAADGAGVGLKLSQKQGGGDGAVGVGGGVGVWGETKEKREMGLKERKERMILEARRRMLEKQEREAAAAAASST